MNPLEEDHAHFAQAAHVEGQVVVVGCLVVPAVPSIGISGNQENFVSNQQQTQSSQGPLNADPLPVSAKRMAPQQSADHAHPQVGHFDTPFFQREQLDPSALRQQPQLPGRHEAIEAVWSAILRAPQLSQPISEAVQLAPSGAHPHLAQHQNRFFQKFGEEGAL